MPADTQNAMEQRTDWGEMLQDYRRDHVIDD
jgi:hypothetical protein